MSGVSPSAARTAAERVFEVSAIAFDLDGTLPVFVTVIL